MLSTSLSSHDWTLIPLTAAPITLPESIPATVPGCVHTDLLAADLIPDPYLGQNELTQHWIGQGAWRYATTLPIVAGEHDRIDLVADGLDTVATLRLGHHQIGATANMHRRYRFDVTSALNDSRELTIDFASGVREADRRSQELRPRAFGYPHPYNAIRKMACSYGWDWGLDTATAGIWKDIRLEAWSIARLGRVLTDARPLEGGRGEVHVRVELERTREQALTLTASLGTGTSTLTVDVAPSDTHAELTLSAEQVELWWPVGHGEPRLYDLAIELRAGDTQLDRVDRRVGFRTVRWDITPDEAGVPFTLVLNDRPIEVHGVNWIPDNAFVSDISRARIERRFNQAIFAHTNLIRIWGGGLYESEDFYDLADELGLLVWQDFPLACAAYAEEEPLYSEFIAEAQDNVARLGHRASLVLWNGNNENLWGKHSWGWDRILDGHTWGEKYYFTDFPRIVADLAPTSCYTPGSPWSPIGEGITTLDGDPNDEQHGTMHIWDMWNSRPATGYRDYRPRLVAEFGWQGPPTWSTMQTFGDDPLTPVSPGTFVHQKAADGDNKLTAGLIPNLELPTDIETWHWAMQWNQADAVRTAITWYRSLYPHCMGTITWQLNDCWPVISWAAVDGYGRPKPLLYALGQANRPRLITIEPVKANLEDGADAGALRLTVVNDTDEPVTGPAIVQRRRYDGTVLAATELPLAVAARSAGTVELGELSKPGDPASELLVATVNGDRAFWFFAAPRHSELPPAAFRIDTAPTATGTRVTVHADTVLRDLTLLVDKITPEAEADSALVTLLPGELHHFEVNAPISTAQAQAVVVSVNDLIVRA